MTVTVYGDADSGWAASAIEASCETSGSSLDSVVRDTLACLRSSLKGLGETAVQFVWWIGPENAPDTVVIDITGNEILGYDATSGDSRFSVPMHGGSLDLLSKHIATDREGLGVEETMVSLVFSRRETL